MPRTSERQQLIEQLVEAYITQLIVSDDGSDSDVEMDSSSSASSTGSSGSSDGSSNSSSASDNITSAIISTLAEISHHHYQVERRSIPKTNVNVQLLLNQYKANFPDIFRSYLRISPTCFDDLVLAISDHPIFHNNSNNSQMPVDIQLAITLYRFGHYGNAAGTHEVALWAGVGYGTVCNATARVMVAICDERFRRATMPWPTEAEIESAKAWVEANSCPAWRNGWLMVDGTLVPIFQRPHEFGNAYFDRKSNYSLNVQVSDDSMYISF